MFDVTAQVVGSVEEGESYKVTHHKAPQEQLWDEVRRDDDHHENGGNHVNIRTLKEDFQNLVEYKAQITYAILEANRRS